MVSGRDQQMARFAEENLGETEEIRVKSVSELRVWLSKRGSDVVYVEETTMVAFLRSCKYDVEKTKKKLVGYYEMRSKIPEWYRNRDPELPEMRAIMDLGLFLPLRRFQDGKLVVLIRAKNYDIKKHSLNDLLKFGKMIMDVAALEFENATVYGIVVIIDGEEIKLRQATQVTPSIIKNFVSGLQSDHWRPKQIEYLNMPFYVNFILTLGKACVSCKIRDRIRGHANVNSLHRVVRREILPPEYGGGGETIDSLVDYWARKVLSYRQWFANDEKYGIC